jgi:uncharacterized protein
VARLIGMIHLGPLPGSPRYGGDLDGVVAAAVRDATALAAAGFDALAIENFGDAPFFADDVPKVTVAAVTRAAAAVRTAVDVPLGINVLRNDAIAALAVAAAVDAAFIRVNVLAGMMHTDQGAVTGRAADVMRVRAATAPEVQVFADVFVKHATPPPGLTLEQASADLVGRALADALIVSGESTGVPPGPETISRVRHAVPDTPIYIGSGVTPATVAGFLESADGVIVGTSIKQDGVTTNPVDPVLAAALVAAAGGRATP